MAAKTQKPVIVRVPTISPATKAKVGAIARRGASIAGRYAMQEKHTIAAVAAAAVFGYLRRANVGLPKIDAIGTTGTYGLVAWGLGRWTKSPIAQHIATGLLSTAAYQLAAGQTIGGGEIMGDVMGEDAGMI